MTSTETSASRLLAHNLDACLALLAFPRVPGVGLPLEGWFWATLLWALNRYLSVVIERRAAKAAAAAGGGHDGHQHAGAAVDR